jgi:hypothetical protein
LFQPPLNHNIPHFQTSFIAESPKMGGFVSTMIHLIPAVVKSLDLIWNAWVCPFHTLFPPPHLTSMHKLGKHWKEEHGADTGRDPSRLITRSTNGQQGNMLITFKDHGILTNRDINWSDGVMESCDQSTGLAPVMWKGHEMAGAMVNVSNVCGGNVKRAMDVLGDWLPGEGPHGTFNGVVPSGTGSQAKIEVSLHLLLDDG